LTSALDEARDAAALAANDDDAFAGDLDDRLARDYAPHFAGACKATLRAWRARTCP
jgi:hypothetical protein